MKKLLSLTLLLVCLLGFNSCSTTQIYSIMGNYVPQNSVTTSTSFDKVWTKVVDFFAENSIPITTLSKESGLIVANDIPFGENVVSYEDASGQIVNKNAWFVLPYAKQAIGARATGAFNVRIKTTDDGQTNIQINCSNLVGNYKIQYVDNFFQKQIIWNTYPRECKSTGVFEKTLLELFK